MLCISLTSPMYRPDRLPFFGDGAVANRSLSRNSCLGTPQRSNRWTTTHGLVPTSKMEENPKMVHRRYSDIGIPKGGGPDPAMMTQALQEEFSSWFFLYMRPFDRFDTSFVQLCLTITEKSYICLDEHGDREFGDHRKHPTEGK